MKTLHYSKHQDHHLLRLLLRNVVLDGWTIAHGIVRVRLRCRHRHRRHLHHLHRHHRLPEDPLEE